MPAALTRALCSLRPGVEWRDELFALFVSPTLPVVRELAPAAFWDALLKEGLTIGDRMLIFGVKHKGKRSDDDGGDGGDDDVVARARLAEAMTIAAQLCEFCPRTDLAEVMDGRKQIAVGTCAAPNLSWRCFVPSGAFFDDGMCRALVELVRNSPNLAVVDLFGTAGVRASTVKALTDLAHVRAVGVAGTEHFHEIIDLADHAKLVIVGGNERYKRFKPGGAEFDLHRRFEAFRYGVVYALREMAQ